MRRDCATLQGFFRLLWAISMSNVSDIDSLGVLDYPCFVDQGQEVHKWKGDTMSSITLYNNSFKLPARSMWGTLQGRLCF